mgnify:FL=1
MTPERRAEIGQLVLAIKANPVCRETFATSAVVLLWDALTGTEAGRDGLKKELRKDGLRKEHLKANQAALERHNKEIARLTAESEGRLAVLGRLSEDRRDLWIAKERAEANLAQVRRYALLLEQGLSIHDARFEIWGEEMG